MKQWLAELIDAGLLPYVATSEKFLNYLDLSAFGGKEVVKLLERPEDANFHEAYLVSNSFAFGNPNLKMPNWVYLDCVLMQTAVVGFCIPVDIAPPTMIDYYEKDPWVDINKLDYIPVSGQIAALGIDGKRLTGFSLFSLRKQIGHMDIHQLALKTKYAAMLAYRAHEADIFVGMSQYDNKALKTHAAFGRKMYIEDVMAPLHPLKDMSFTYAVKVELDDDLIFRDMGSEAKDFDFLLRADDFAKKKEMQERAKAGEKFWIADPVQVKKNDGIYLPIKIEKE